jgi:hypothetical protein
MVNCEDARLRCSIFLRGIALKIEGSPIPVKWLCRSGRRECPRVDCLREGEGERR